MNKGLNLRISLDMLEPLDMVVMSMGDDNSLDIGSFGLFKYLRHISWSVDNKALVGGFANNDIGVIVIGACYDFQNPYSFIFIMYGNGVPHSIQRTGSKMGLGAKLYCLGNRNGRGFLCQFMTVRLNRDWMLEIVSLPLW